MADIILHHYPASLFSEKIRLLLGCLGLSWKSVLIPPIMPRPHLMPLTGGYRRTPVMQEGADVYCDTKIIAERLAARAGRPEIHAGFVAHRVAEWADSHLFRVAVAVMFQPRAIGETMKNLDNADIAAFQKDRAELTQGAPIVTIPPEAAETHLVHYLAELDAALQGREFLFGKVPTIADFSVFHCLWFVGNNAVVAPLLEDHPSLGAWRRRMTGFGHGTSAAMDAEKALRIGTDASPGLPPLGEPVSLSGLEPGRQVAVSALDYGRVPITGELVACTTREVAVRRQDPTAGEIVAHFPRQGFGVAPA